MRAIIIKFFIFVLWWGSLFALYVFIDWLKDRKRRKKKEKGERRMSVIVVGMKMPTCCVMCPLWNHEFGFCNFCGKDSSCYNEDGEIYDTFEERYKGCPLKEKKE